MLPLINRTEQSYGRSMMKPQNLVDYCVANKVSVVAVTDIHSLSAIPEFLSICEKSNSLNKHQIKGIAGLTLQVKNGSQQLGEIVLLAKGDEGFASLKSLIDIAGHISSDTDYNPNLGIQFKDLISDKVKPLLAHTVALDGFPGSLCHGLLKRDDIKPYVKDVSDAINDISKSIYHLKNAFLDGDYLAVNTIDYKSPLVGAMTQYDSVNQKTIEPMGAIEVSIASAVSREDIQLTKQWFLDYASRFLAKEADQPNVLKMVNKKYSSRSLEESNISDVPSAINLVTAKQISERCPSPNVHSEKPVSNLLLGGADVEPLRQLVGVKWNEFKTKLTSQEDKEKYRKRLVQELSVISSLGFENYFLNIRKLQVLSEELDNPFMLRGSAVASLVMHVLDMTPIDPLKDGVNLLFKRFLDADRVAEPDVDIEFMNNNQITRAMGQLFSGQIAVLSKETGYKKVGTLIKKAAETIKNFYSVTDDEKVKIDRAATVLIAELDNPDKTDRKSPSRNWSEWTQSVYPNIPDHLKDKYTKKIVDIANEFSKIKFSSGGSKDSLVFMPEGVSESFNLLKPSKTSNEHDLRRINQTKFNILPTGHIKYDILSNHYFGRLMRLSKSLGYEGELRGADNDPSIKFIMERGATLGLMQLGGYVGSTLALRVKPQNIDELTALNALIRDGGDKSLSSSIDSYVASKAGSKDSVIEDIYKPILSDTHGSLLYEEQLMKALTEVSGFTWAEADKFRSRLKKADPNVIEDYRADFINRAAAKHTVSIDEAAKWYKPIEEKKGRFVFNKAHAIAYAYVTVKQCYMKSRHPASFAAELFLDETLKLLGTRATLAQVLDDWKKLQFDRELKQTASTFVKTVVSILIREEKNPDSTYERNVGNVLNKIIKNIDAGNFDQLMNNGLTRAALKAQTERLFTLKLNGYAPVTLDLENNINFTIQDRKLKQSNSSKTNLGETGKYIQRVGESGISEDVKKLPPANRRKEYIQWQKKVMMAHLLEFLKDEGVLDGFSIERASGSLDSYRFNVKDQNGSQHDFHIKAPSILPYKMAQHDTKKNDISTGFFQGGARDKKKASILGVANEIAELTGFIPHQKWEIGKGGDKYLNRVGFKEIEKMLSIFARKAKSELLDMDSSGVQLGGFVPQKPTAPALYLNNENNVAGKSIHHVFTTRSLETKKLMPLFEKGHLSVAELWSDAIFERKGERFASRSPIANYRKVSDKTPLYNVPLVVDGKHSTGGQQKFFIDSKKQRATKMDLGFTTKKLKSIAFGDIKPGSETLWLTEAAIDTMSFNEIQDVISDVNKITGKTLPVLEKNSISIKSAGGATALIESMLNVRLVGKGADFDFSPLKRTEVTLDLTEKEAESIKAWMMDTPMHWLDDNSELGMLAKEKLFYLMSAVGMSSDEITKTMIIHPMDKTIGVEGTISGIYQENKKNPDFRFLHHTNFDTWLRGSELRFDMLDNGTISTVGIMADEIEEGRLFSEMTLAEKEKISISLASRFKYLSGARSFGIALDNDGAGLEDATKAKAFFDLIGVPTGQVMPYEMVGDPSIKDPNKGTHKYPQSEWEERTIPTNLLLKNEQKNMHFGVELKDHNDYLSRYKGLKSEGRVDDSLHLIERYAKSIQVPKYTLELVSQDVKLNQDSQYRLARK